MAGIEPRPFSVGSDHSANCATTITRYFVLAKVLKFAVATKAKIFSIMHYFVLCLIFSMMSMGFEPTTL